MGVQINPESDYAKELARWNTPKSQGGHGADGYEPFPKMLYKAIKKDNGKVYCGDPLDEQFSQRCQTIVRNDQELSRARDMGWRDTPDAALAYHEALEQEMARAAAEVAYASQRMSGQARAELAAAEQATSDHVTDVPRARRKPGRKPKVAAVVTTEG